MVVSPDEKTLYIVGTFTKMGDETRNRIAAFDATTGALLPFAPSLNGPAYGVKVVGADVYVVGGFSTRERSRPDQGGGVHHGRRADQLGAERLRRRRPPAGHLTGPDADRSRRQLHQRRRLREGVRTGHGRDRQRRGRLYPMAINNVVRNGSTLEVRHL